MKRICLLCKKEFEGKISNIHCPDCVKKIRADTRRSKTCPDCGTKFDGFVASVRCPQCSDIRARELKRISNKNYKLGTARKLGGTDYCEACGKEYTIFHPAQKYCPDCSEEVRKKNSAEHSRNRMKKINYSAVVREHRREATPLMLCPICGKSFNPYPSKGACSEECCQILKKIPPHRNVSVTSN